MKIYTMNTALSIWFYFSKQITNFLLLLLCLNVLPYIRCKALFLDCDLTVLGTNEVCVLLILSF